MYERYVELLNEKQVRNIDVSRATGIPSSTFSDWKKGKSSPKYDKIQKIAEYFGVEPDWLSGKSEFKTREEMLQHFDKNFNSTKVAEEITTLELVEKNFGKDAVKVLQMFCEMNETGQQKVLEDMSDLIQLPKYVQKDSTMLKNA